MRKKQVGNKFHYIVHKGKQTFRCDICGKIFTNKINLAKHIGAIHEGNKPFKCDVCDYSSSKAELLQLNRTQFPSLGIFISKKVGNRKN